MSGTTSGLDKDGEVVGKGSMYHLSSPLYQHDYLLTFLFFFLFSLFFSLSLFCHLSGAYEQSKRCFEIIENAIKQLAPECGMHSLVRTRLFVTDIR